MSSADAVPSGAPSGADAEYAARLACGEFAIQRCLDCADAIFYPRVVCPHCGSERLTWFRPSGLGTVYSTTTVRGREASHNVSLIDLEEGPRLMSRVVGMDSTDVRIGMSVRAVVAEQDGAPLVVFEWAGR